MGCQTATLHKIKWLNMILKNDIHTRESYKNIHYNKMWKCIR